MTAGIDFGLALFATALFNQLFNYPTTPALDHPHLRRSRSSFTGCSTPSACGWWRSSTTSLSGGISSASLIIVGVLFFVPSHHQSVSFVFTKFVNNTGLRQHSVLCIPDRPSARPVHVHRLRRLGAHDRGDDQRRVAGPRGIVWSIVVSLFAGWLLLIGVTSAHPELRHGSGRGRRRPAPDLHRRRRYRTWAPFLLFIVVGAQFYCGMSSVTANSRMIYAFSRDGAVPGSQFWHKINPRTRTPTNSIWFAAVGAFILGLAVPVEPRRLLRRHLDRGDRAVHRVRHSDPAAATRR